MKSKKIIAQLAGVMCLVGGSTLQAGPLQEQGMRPPPPQPPTTDAREITPEAGPHTVWAVDPFFTADFIYWTSRQEGLSYAITGADVRLLAIDTSPGSIHQPDWEFSPGFKVGAGLQMQHDGWDVYANYTWLHSDANDSVSDENGILPTLTNALYILLNASVGIISGRPDKATTSWSHHFNVIDLELGRNYYISSALTLRPHVGLKGTWQDQDLHTVYYITDGTTFATHGHQDSWGVGVRAGLDTCWYFIPSFGLYGDFALTGLWSGFNSTRKDREKLPNLEVTEYLNTTDINHSVKPVIEFGIGLRYEYYYNQDDFRFLIQAGWEEQIWLGNNQFIDVAEYGDRGNLSLQGLTLEVRLDF
ncbi:MAG: MOMP family protein [Simkania sp.]|nr:MOMP family protein [Simkania sp.]MCB1074058.1 MOMP family protein [Simkania sp.]MCP5491309.1 MOMP family protein [Chlamydiales bacterium]